MLFFEPAFFVFFAVYCALHMLLPPRWRLWLVIGGSTVFYARWRPAYIALPYILAFMAWASALWLDGAREDGPRRRRLALTLILIFLPLAVVKYAGFLVHDVLRLDDVAKVPALRWPLPLGISFITFTLSAYVIDVSRRNYPIERSFPVLLGHTLFFPHLIAGPILRPSELMPQLRRPRPALGARFKAGVTIFTAGLVKKLVFADAIGQVVDLAYSGGAGRDAWRHLIAIYGFAVQIYCDFSGYSDMAVGLAAMLHIRLPANFRRPYAAASMVDFWRRWHVTLSHWLRDYLYIPLGGNRGGRLGQLRNILITMMLGGLWHGANWTFLAWGLLHGAALGINHVVRRPMARAGLTPPAWLARLLTFHFVVGAWIFFRARTMGEAGNIVGSVIHGDWSGPGQILHQQAYVLLLRVIFYAVHRYDRHVWMRLAARRVRPALLFPALGLCWILAIALSPPGTAKFIYFDF